MSLTIPEGYYKPEVCANCAKPLVGPIFCERTTDTLGGDIHDYVFCSKDCRDIFIPQLRYDIWKARG